MSKLPDEIREALRIIQACFYPIPNRVDDDFEFVEEALGFLQGLVQILDSLIERRGGTLYNAVQRRINIFVQLFAPQIERTAPFPVLVSRQKMTGQRDVDMLWFLVNQLCSTGEAHLPGAFKVLCAYSQELYSQVAELNFLNIAQFLQLSRCFEPLHTTKAPSVSVYAETFLRKYFLGGDVSPPYRTASRAASRAGSRAGSRCQSGRPVEGRLQSSRLGVSCQEGHGEVSFFGWFSALLDRKYESFQEDFRTLIQEYEASEYFAENIVQPFAQNIALAFQERVFISCSGHDKVQDLLEKHFAVSAPGDDAVGFLVLLSLLLNLLQQCLYYTGILNIEQAMGYMREKIDLQKTQTQEEQRDDDLIDPLSLDDADREELEELSLGDFQEPDATSILHVDKIKAALMEEAGIDTLETNPVAFVQQIQAQTQQLEYQFLLHMQTLSGDTGSDGKRAEVTEVLHARKTACAVLTKQIHAQTNDYRTYLQELDIKALASLLKDTRLRNTLEAATRQVEVHGLDTVTKSTLIHQILGALHVATLRAQQPRQRNEEISSDEAVALFDTVQLQTTKIKSSNLQLNDYEVCKLLAKTQRAAKHDMASFKLTAQTLYGNKCEMFLQNLDQTLVLQYLQAQTPNINNTTTVGEFLDNQQLSVFVCPESISQDIKTLYACIIKLTMSGYALIDGKGDDYSSNIKTIDEVRHMMNADIQTDSDAVIQVYYAQTPGLKNLKTGEVLREANYKMWVPELNIRRAETFSYTPPQNWQ